jgi:hypothetical protein
LVFQSKIKEETPLNQKTMCRSLRGDARGCFS